MSATFAARSALFFLRCVIVAQYAAQGQSRRLREQIERAVVATHSHLFVEQRFDASELRRVCVVCYCAGLGACEWRRRSCKLHFVRRLTRMSCCCGTRRRRECLVYAVPEHRWVRRRGLGSPHWRRHGSRESRRLIMRIRRTATKVLEVPTRVGRDLSRRGRRHHASVSLNEGFDGSTRWWTHQRFEMPELRRVCEDVLWREHRATERAHTAQSIQRISVSRHNEEEAKRRTADHCSPSR